MNYLEMLLNAIGMTDVKNDAKYTAALDLDLEAVKAQTYDVKYPELKARSLVPMDSSIPSGAETYSYRQWDEYGMAEIVANYADDFANVDAKAEKFVGNIESIGDSYQYSVQDLRRSAMTGESLDARRALAARHAIERKIDQLVATGDAKIKLKGLVNHPNVTVNAATTDGTSARWIGGRTTPKAPELILKDMNDLAASIRIASKHVHMPTTLVLSIAEWEHIARTAVDSTNRMTILQAFLANGNGINEVIPWHRLDLADAAGTGPRMLCYQKSAEVLDFKLPQDFESFPPQAKNMALSVVCHARVGGVCIYYPLAVAYMDGI